MKTPKIAALVMAGFFLWSAPETSMSGPRGLALSVEQAGPAVLPHQAVRLRLKLRNVGDDAIGPLPRLEHTFVVSGVKAPGALDYYAIRANVTPLGAPTDVTPRHGTAAAPLVMKPGDEVSVTFAFAAEWGREPHSLFPLPGEYYVRIAYGAPTGDVFAEPFAVVVQQPVGEDAGAHQLLKDDPALAAVLMSPVEVPDPALRAALDALVRRFPRSSYVDYARFALGRSHLKGTSATRAPSEGERVAAIQHLEQIDPKTFAYGPNVLVLLSKIGAPDLDKAQRTRTTLDRDFSDALETLEVRPAGDSRSGNNPTS